MGCKTINMEKIMSRHDKVGSHKTTVFSDSDGSLCCVYHKTIVAKKLLSGIVVLNSGGYRTNTTKLRMNQFSNQFCDGLYTVYQRKGTWYVDIFGMSSSDSHLHKNTLVFNDNAQVLP